MGRLTRKTHKSVKHPSELLEATIVTFLLADFYLNTFEQTALEARFKGQIDAVVFPSVLKKNLYLDLIKKNYATQY